MISSSGRLAAHCGLDYSPPAMKVVFSSDSGLSRPKAVEHVRSLKAQNPRLKVVDIGGAANPWSADVADAYVDMRPVPGLRTLTGDIQDPGLWREIRSEGFDFCICSHTLEDIRDPLFVLAHIRDSFSQGYIAVPSKHVEFGHIESRRYVGYGHHRWIFTLAPQELRLIAKWPFASHFSPRRRALASFKASAAANAYRRLRGRKPGLSAIGPLPWWRRDLAGPNNELAFIWEGPLAFRVINADYAGESVLALARLYRDELAAGL